MDPVALERLAGFPGGGGLQDCHPGLECPAQGISCIPPAVFGFRLPRFQPELPGTRQALAGSTVLRPDEAGSSVCDIRNAAIISGILPDGVFISPGLDRPLPGDSTAMPAVKLEGTCDCMAEIL